MKTPDLDLDVIGRIFFPAVHYCPVMPGQRCTTCVGRALLAAVVAERERADRIALDYDGAEKDLRQLRTEAENVLQAFGDEYAGRLDGLRVALGQHKVREAESNR